MRRTPKPVLAAFSSSLSEFEFFLDHPKSWSLLLPTVWSMQKALPGDVFEVQSVRS